MFCSDLMRGSRFIAQTSKFLLIDATAMTLGQGHGKVIQYISPDPYILCAKYQKFSSNGFDVRGESFYGGGSGRGGNELKTSSHPRPGWLNKMSLRKIHLKLQHHFLGTTELNPISLLTEECVIDVQHKQFLVWPRFVDNVNLIFLHSSLDFGQVFFSIRKYNIKWD